MITYARLVGTKVEPIGGNEVCMTWAKEWEKADRRIARTVLSYRKHIFVSTVFLGLNHGWSGEDLWFETMVFGTSIDGEMFRYATHAEAVAGHAVMLRRARQARQIRGDGRRDRRKASRAMARYARKIVSYNRSR